MTHTLRVVLRLGAGDHSPFSSPNPSALLSREGPLAAQTHTLFVQCHATEDAIDRLRRVLDAQRNVTQTAPAGTTTGAAAAPVTTSGVPPSTMTPPTAGASLATVGQLDQLEHTSPAAARSALLGIEGRAAATVGDAMSFFRQHGVTDAEGNGALTVGAISPDALEQGRITRGQLFNAFYTPQTDHIAVGFDPKSGQSFASSKDVLYHEYSHRIVSHLVPGWVDSTRSRTVNESLADTFASLMQGNWEVGDDTGNVIRDIPDATVHGTQGPATLGQERSGTADANQSHANSLVPSRAAYLTWQQLGTDATTNLYLWAMRHTLSPNPDTLDLARAVQQGATAIWGAGSAQANAVASAWQQVGIDAANGRSLDGSMPVAG